MPNKEAATSWPAYTVVRKPLEWLKDYERNARTHSKEQIEQIRQSLREFGWTVPVLAREDGTIIAGHGRVLAAKREKIAEAPVIIAIGWTEAQCRAYGLADNRIALNSGWDENLLGIEMGELAGLGVDLGTLGFDGDEINPQRKSDATPDASPQLDGLRYSIVLRCNDEKQQAELLDKLEKEGLTCEALIS